uniref:Uncharacterized protein LOC111099804 n=1 Tax=Crassostrea virginica TaxID=6565 RepID=A0A8B8A683_CRAVI|nr:uncharacterized protein LOC111099804 [Crassostrea virginica]XP_022286978.1 uncharacterized protein LOC111099804 [Crassostrea virginica]
MKRTLMVHWKDLTEGFIVRESEEVIFRALEAVGQLCYSGDMFDNWTYFGPVEMIEKDRYSKNEDGIEVTDEDILTEIHHLTMAVKAAQLDDYPESHSESGHSGSHNDSQTVHPSHLANLYWEARLQVFHDMRGKLFTEELLRLLFKGLENVNITFSTGGCDSYLWICLVIITRSTLYQFQKTDTK